MVSVEARTPYGNTGDIFGSKIINEYDVSNSITGQMSSEKTFYRTIRKRHNSASRLRIKKSKSTSKRQVFFKLNSRLYSTQKPKQRTIEA